MAGTFGGAVQTVNSGFDASKDKTTPNLRALSLGSMSSPGALAGTTGVDVELIHGDCWNQITGNVTTNIKGNNKYTLTGNSLSLITGNLKETVNGNHEYDVLTNMKLFIKGTTTEEHVGSHLNTNTSSLTESFTGPVMRTYEATTTEEHPESWIQKIQEALHFEPFKYETFGIVASAAVSKVDVIGASVCIRAVGLGMGAEEGEFKVNKFRIVSAEEELHAAMVDTFALQLHLGALDAGTPFKPNALPRPTCITPFD